MSYYNGEDVEDVSGWRKTGREKEKKKEKRKKKSKGKRKRVRGEAVTRVQTKHFTHKHKIEKHTLG